MIGVNNTGEEIDIVTHDGQIHTGDVSTMQRIGKLDLGEIIFRSSEKYPSIKKAEKIPAINSQITIYGHPNQLTKGRTSVGNLVANAQMDIGYGYQLLYTNQTFSGMSGAPITNIKGELVGIHGRGEINIKRESNDAVSIKTGINQGIPITFVTKWELGLPVSLADSKETTYSDYVYQAVNSYDIPNSEQTIIRLTNQALTEEETSFAFSLRARAHKGLGQTSEAFQDISKAISLEPWNSLYLITRGEMYTAMGMYENAEDDYTRALDADNTVPADLKLASLSASLLAQNKYEEVISLLRPATLKYRDSSFINQNLAVAYYFKKLPFLAEKFAYQAIAIERDLIMPYLLIAEIKANNYMDSPEALRILDQGLSLNPGNEDLIMRKCLIAARAQSISAKNYCSEATKLKNLEYRADALVMRAFAFQEEENHDSAINDFETHIRISATVNPQIYLFLALSYLDKGIHVSACSNWIKFGGLTRDNFSDKKLIPIKALFQRHCDR